MQTPSVGRGFVHYVNQEFHAAAIITDVVDSERGIVQLTVFYPGGQGHCVWNVLYDARMSPGTWHYPEHVGTVQWHESEDDEASKREGPVSNSPEIDSARGYPDPEKSDDDDIVLDGDGRDSTNIPASLRDRFES